MPDGTLTRREHVMAGRRPLQPFAPSHIREDARGWFVEVVNAGPWETVISAAMRAGAILGNHYHRRTRILLYLVTGSAEVHVVRLADEGRRTCRLRGREAILLETDEAHAIRFVEDSTVLLLKSQRYAPEDPDTYPFDVLSPAAR